MSGPIFWLHLQTRCGCSRRLSNGATIPPPEWVVPLEPSMSDRRDRVEALRLTDYVGEVTREQERTRIMSAEPQTRRFRLVSFSGDREHGGTGLYEEV